MSDHSRWQIYSKLFNILIKKSSNNITTIGIEGEAWFFAKEVCDLLGINNSKQAVSTLDDDEKSSVSFNDGTYTNVIGKRKSIFSKFAEFNFSFSISINLVCFNQITHHTQTVSYKCLGLC